MTLSRDELIVRLRQLAETLTELKTRVRSAVAVETASAVSQTVKDLLLVALGSRTQESFSPRNRDWRYDAASHDAASWADEDEFADEPEWSSHPVREPEPDAPVSRWPDVLSVASATVNAWANHRLPAWAAATIGIVTGVVATVGGPLWLVSKTLSVAAIDLLPHLVPVHAFS